MTEVSVLIERPFFQHLAIPVEKEVRMYSSETWDVVFTLTDSKIKEVRAICVTGFPLDQENLGKILE